MVTVTQQRSTDSARFAWRSVLSDAAWAAGISGILSGIPSTAWVMVTGGDLLEAGRAAGNLHLPATASAGALLAAGGLAHAVVTAFWSVALSAGLPKRRTVLWGAAFSLGIAALDLGVIGQFFPLIKALAVGPQIADHLAFGVVAAAVIAWRRKRRARR